MKKQAETKDLTSDYELAVDNYEQMKKVSKGKRFDVENYVALLYRQK
jgi:ABC-type uncharacterized transport system ATPase subunit